MIVWRTWICVTIKRDELGGREEKRKIYKMLLLFGFIPLFISIDG